MARRWQSRSPNSFLWLEPMSASGKIAVLDIGKTNIKLVVFDRAGNVLWEKSQPNRPVQSGLYPHADVEKILTFLLEALRDAASRFTLDVLIPATHGATGALIDAHGLVLPVMDYEFAGLNDIEARYKAIRPAFSETFSPHLPTGLNLGRQIAYQAWHYPQLYANATHFLTYPQYWGWRLTGALASDITSLGCHTDLWRPEAAKPSALSDELDLTRKLPPLLSSWATLGTVLPEVAALAGVPQGMSVLCGIHDSNAALLPYLISRNTPFTVLSTGTWVIFMAVGHSLAHLSPNDDMMANIDANGRPTACARFMGGREYAEICGDCSAEPGLEHVQSLITENTLALPSFSPHGGPFAAQKGHIEGPLQSEQRSSLATLYCALMSDLILTRMGVASGEIIVDGSFARNQTFCAILAQLRPGQSLLRATDQAGTARGAALLADWPHKEVQVETQTVTPATLADLQNYRSLWRTRIN